MLFIKIFLYHPTMERRTLLIAVLKLLKAMKRKIWKGSLIYFLFKYNKIKINAQYSICYFFIAVLVI